MLGLLSLGLLKAPFIQPLFICGSCNRGIYINGTHIPAYIPVNEISRFYRCPLCGFQSVHSRIIDFAVNTEDLRFHSNAVVHPGK